MQTQDLYYSIEEYDRMVAETVQEIIKLGKLKGAEYAGDLNRLDNFVRGAKDSDILLPERVWKVYAGKHWDALSQYIRDLENGVTRVRMESLDGRVDDIIVYLLLFKGMIRARAYANKPRDVEAQDEK